MKVNNILIDLYNNYQDGNEWDKAQDKIEQYINQRVIEELESIYNRAQGIGRNITNVELKQEIDKLKENG